MKRARGLGSLLLPLVFPGSALAQDRSDLMPAEPAPPAASQGQGTTGYSPSVRAATGLPPSASPPTGPATGGPAAPAGNGGLGTAVLEPEDREGYGRGGVVDVAPSKIPEVHLVQRGDTLWDISGYYFRNPWYWPKLWSLNPAITNPHWIYPGDLVRLAAPGQAAATPLPAHGEPETPRLSVSRTTAPTGVLLRQTGFVEQGDLDAAATIVGSKEEKILLSTLDEAYVEYPSKARPLRTGDRYTIYRVEREVKHPTTGEKLGSIVEIMGEVQVDRLTKERVASSTIVDAISPVERGDRVGPLRRQFKLVEPTANTKELEGSVVAALRPTRLLGSDMLVFLDRGKRDGVAMGNRFFVVRRGDAYAPLLADAPQDDRHFPREVVAEVLVVDVRDQTCTGVVTRALKEVQVGDRVEARKGY